MPIFAIFAFILKNLNKINFDVKYNCGLYLSIIVDVYFSWNNIDKYDL